MQSFVQLAMFDLDLESTMGRGDEERQKYSLPHPTPLLIFTAAHPQGTNFFLSPAFCCH